MKITREIEARIQEKEEYEKAKKIPREEPIGIYKEVEL